MMDIIKNFKILNQIDNRIIMGNKCVQCFGDKKDPNHLDEI